MRLNKFISQATELSRRQADEAIVAGRIKIDGNTATLGQQVSEDNVVELDGKRLEKAEYLYVLMNKPIRYVCSRKQQDDKPTVYDLLPGNLTGLKIAGRLDADSRGLILLTNDGDFANYLMHPSNQKVKHYQVKLDREITDADIHRLASGVELEDGVSKLGVEKKTAHLKVTMAEGRNRQIRRTFEALGYEVTDLFRTKIGPYSIDMLHNKQYNTVNKL